MQTSNANVTINSLHAIASIVLPAARYSAIRVGLSAPTATEWVTCFEFAWYAGLDPAHALATVRRQFACVSASSFDLMPLADKQAEMSLWDDLEGFELGGCHRSDFEDLLSKVKAAL